MLFSVPIAKGYWKFLWTVIMEILKAIVEPYRSFDPENIINAVLLPGPVNIKVKYTSPNHQRYFYGLFAPPTVGSEILVYSDNSEYYYLTTIVGHGEMLGKISKDIEGNAAPLYSDRKMFDPFGNPTAMFFKNHKDAGLKIQNYYAQGEPIVNQVELKSSKNQQIILSDSPQANGVIIKNSPGDYICLGGPVQIPYTPNPTKGYIPRGMEINTFGTQQCIVGHGSYKIQVTEGRDITLTNTSEGLYKLKNLSESSTGGDPGLMWGNINLISKWRDINIFTDNPSPNAANSNIFISTQKGIVQINSGGDIKLFSKFKVTVQAESGIDLLSTGGDINIEATGGNVNIKGGINTNVEGTTQLNAYGFVATNLGALTPLTLNSVTQTALPSLSEVAPRKNAYGR